MPIQGVLQINLEGRWCGIQLVSIIHRYHAYSFFDILILVGM
jgi:hypothetical protein